MADDKPYKFVPLLAILTYSRERGGGSGGGGVGDN